MKKVCLLNCLGGIINGIRLDSGPFIAGEYAVPNAMDLTAQEKRNIVVKISNTNFMPAEKVKFIELKKDKTKQMNNALYSI
jgi:hypothetical protein